jgi:hypothetical protein
MHDGRFEKIEQIRIQYFHVVLKAAGEFIFTKYAKPAAMMTWDEQTKHVWVSLPFLFIPYWGGQNSHNPL